MKKLQRSKFAASCSSLSTSLLRMKATMRKTPSTKKTMLAMVLTILMMQKWGRSPGSCRILPSRMKKLFKLGLICSRSITTVKDLILDLFHVLKKVFLILPQNICRADFESLADFAKQFEKGCCSCGSCYAGTIFSLIHCIVHADCRC